LLQRCPKLKDYQRGFKLLKQAAALNHIGAYGWLGAAFDYGLGTRANRRRAFQCYLRAAKEAEPNSEYHVGIFYMAGRGVRKNRTLAVEWLQRASSHGDEFAIHALGKSYRYGQE
jgi:hypothetical protein